MKKPAKKTKTTKCEFCSPESSPELCKLSTATTVIDGKEYAACCVKCGDQSLEEKPKRDKAKNEK
jgi:hypothetical protein